MQLVFVGIMAIIIPFIKESPRWLASKGRNTEALKNLAWVRRRPEDDYRVQAELAEIVAAVDSEKEQMAGVSWTKEITAKGKPKRFIIAILMFVCQRESSSSSPGFKSNLQYLTSSVVSSQNGPDKTLSTTTPPRSSTRSESPVPRPLSSLPVSTDSSRSSPPPSSWPSVSSERAGKSTLSTELWAWGLS